MQKILVITSSYDKTCDYIISKYKDVVFFRLNVDFFSQYLISFSKKGFEINCGDDSITELCCLSIYYRKPSAENLNGIIDSKYHTFVQKESHSLIEGIVESFQGVCLTKPSIMRPVGNKIFQARLASRVCFEIPDYLITNSESHLNEYQSIEAIVKPLSVGVLQNQKTKEFVQTNIVDTSIDLDGLKYSPAYFQHYQQKDFEVRATFIGKTAYVVKIESQNKVDWRKTGNQVIYSVCDMPADIYEKCILFMALSNMQFGCFDFIVYNNIWYFLEMNVNGQWAWLEFETGLNISGSIVRYLRGI